ncbi:UBX domain-containing protein 10 [Malassezia cuniculi]|uniref:UBX domain-containing protein 10 n=1 Tax=Malassezia cuniculi TaxID=948313 RepID=A0AAF0J5Q8_9BASI|nr:UBX domain-containing protein 10 [Malassezia cuniculi]
MSIAALRTELRRAGIPDTEQPDDGTLQVMLDVEGNVQRAAESILANQAAENRISHDSQRYAEAERQPLNTHDSSARAVAPDSTLYTSPWVSIFWRALSLPFSLLHAAITFVLRLLRVTSSSDNIELTRFSQDPHAAAARFIESLERDTNGTTQLPQDRDETMHAMVQLPPFVPRSYSDALQLAKREHRILAVVLTSRVHSDDEYFRKNVLTDRQLVGALSSRDFVVWGGCVQDREAHRVATLLEASTYPFIAFISLQPRRSRTSTVITSKAAVLSRIEGSPQSYTSAGMLVSHINDVLLPRTLPYLERLRSERQRRDSERALMAEQDRAFEAAARRDAERVLQARTEAQRAESLAREREKAAAAAVAEAQRATQWRRWAKKNLVPPEPFADAAVIRLSIHVPDGRNLQRRFKPTDTLESVYIFVETAAEVEEETEKPEYTPTFKFKLVQTYPRKQLGHDLMHEQLGNICGLDGAARLLAEGHLQ